MASDQMGPEALEFAVKTLVQQTPMFCETLHEATGKKIGRLDAVGLFLESRPDERGQLTAFLEDFTG